MARAARGEVPRGFSLLAIFKTWDKPYFSFISEMDNPAE
jgi:hypothetical protein